MNFNAHSNLEGQHAFLGASKHHWINYSDEKLIESFKNNLAKLMGTRKHELASELIKLNIKLPRTKKTLNMYVNDCIGFKMIPEQPLFYSWNAFGTADAISFRKNKLMIFDYKSGKTKASFAQLDIYAALFCLEYKQDPNQIEIEERIYQSDEAHINEPRPEDILYIMEKIKRFDGLMDELKMEV